MKTPIKLALFGAGLVVAFGAVLGLARVVGSDNVAGSGTNISDMHEHHGEHDGGATGHDHAADGGAPPPGIRTAIDPRYPVGTTVLLIADHMPGMNGAQATISGAFDTTTYSVSYTPTTGGEPVVDHRWVVHEELDNPGPAPLADGTEVGLQAEHMGGMNGARATIDSSTDETVYMVDLEADGMEMTNHKWVVESEITPAR
ncbi:YdhK family protein [Rhodococcus sp. NPDC060084]|uniref:YdhK family protein n=1 Tax=Rhodococcus sp. NPDC060084 TaxID=3347053 RepID=UPI0036515AFF